MDQKDKTYQSFLKDESFKNWALQPDQESNQFWQEYIIAHPQEQEEINKARQIIRSIQFDEYKEREADQKYQIFRNIITGQKSARGIVLEKAQFNTQRAIKNSGYWSIAATVLLVIGLGFYFFWYGSQSSIPETKTIATIVKENASGRKSTILLPDGTKVKLNSESRLSYPELFEGDQRTVHLSGEAYFEVAKDPLKPFSVISGDIKTTALGTAFNVQAWQDESVIQVALAEGKVRIGKTEDASANDHYYLDPGQKIVHTANSAEFQISTFDPVQEFGWKEGIIVFHEANLNEFVNKLSRWYGVNFEIRGDKSTQWSIDGRFDNESLEEILQSLSFTYKINYEMKNNKVILKL
jgi:transmembrane sensor